MVLSSGAEVIVGLEVHVELATKTKMFCPCPTAFGQTPNTQVCPICLGLPGVLPQLNREAVKLGVRAALALHCHVNLSSKFDRKNYFYPDLPKGYQISQYDQPLAEWGHLEIDGEDGPRRIAIRRIHLEEEAGKLTHEGLSLWESTGSLVDFNRAGLPLIEIVSEPDLRSPAEARSYLNELRTVLSYLDVSDLRMDEGSMRCDANISLRPPGFSGPLEDLPRVEVKNVNSIRHVVRALEYEVDRQAALVESGERIVRETRGFDEPSGRTISQRSKEQADDYRYFPEPDLPPLVLTNDWVSAQRASLPQLPEVLRGEFQRMGLPAKDARVLAGDPEAARYFQEAVAKGADPVSVATWMLGDLSGLLNENRRGFMDSPITPAALGELMGLISDGTLSGRMAKEVLAQMFNTGDAAPAIVARSGMSQIGDPDLIRVEAKRVIEANPKVVQDFLSGKDKALAFLVGQVMKATRGQAKPDLVNITLRDLLAQDRHGAG